jgi:hypothetical protein
MLCTSIKRIFLFLLFISAVFSSSAQTGVAGVGTSANNVLWLKADAGTSTSTNNTPISFWNDQSGNAIDVTQTVSAQQPSFSTNVINGFPAILFDNVNSSNQNDKLIGPDSPILDNTSGYTFFYVTRPVALGDARVIVSKRTGVAIDQSFMLFYYTSNKLNIDIQTNNDRYASNTTYAVSTNYIGCLIYDGTIATSGLRTTLYDGETFDRNASETSTIVPDNNSPLLIGTTDASDPRPFGGYIAEVIMYRVALGNAQRIIVNNYLSAKYAIALTVNDKYAGDNAANGDYDREVAGIGQESTGSSTSFSASVSGGLSLSVNSGLDNGDYILAGHAVATNTTITTDVGGMTGTNKARWQRIWYVDVTNTAANINTNIEFDMSDGGMNSFTLGVVSDYVLLYRAGQTGNWTELTPASAISGDRILFNNITLTNDGYYTLGTRNYFASPLPITLVSFTAVAEKGVVNLSWTTAAEKNNDYFTLEKSKDGETFLPFKTIKGAGNSGQLKEYRSLDESPLEGISYYRLKQTDYDNEISYSTIVAVDRNSDVGDFVVFPNPNKGNFHIKLLKTNVEELLVTLRNVNGASILLNLKMNKNEEGLFTLNEPNLLPGTYLITMSFGQKNISRILIIE